MSTRVPEFLMYNKSQESMARVREKMMKNQEMAVTGKRVNKASDDPVANMRAISLQAQYQRDDQISQNLELATSIVNISDSTLAELSDLLSRTKELALQMSSTSNNNEDARAAVAKEVGQLRMRAVQLGNARLGDRYIFGGYTTTRPPFDEHGNYFGDDGVVQFETDRGQKLSINVPGVMPFFGIANLPEPVLRKDGDDDENPGGTQGPSISGALRSPASFLADRLGVDEDDSQKLAEIQKTSGVNVFYVLQNFADALENNHPKEINNSIDGLDQAFKQVLQSRAMVGARQNALKLSQESVEIAKESGQTLLSSTQDADIIKVFSDISKNENTLKASLELNKRILTQTLMDYLK